MAALVAWLSAWIVEEREKVGTTEQEGIGLGGTLVGFFSDLLRLKCFWDIPVTLYVCVLVAQLCLTLRNPMDYSPPASSVHGILQARILEWVVIPFSRGPSQSQSQPRSPTLQADSLLSEPPGKPFQWLYWVEKFSWSLTFLTKRWSSSSISAPSLSCNLNLFVSPQQAYSSASMLHGEKALWNQSWLPILLASHLSQWSDVQMTCSNLIESERIMRLPYPLGCEEVHYRIL